MTAPAIRRSAYNKKLLKYNPVTGKSEENLRVPRDLTSHDLIESCIMTTVATQQIYVFEDFPQTLVEWHQRQQRCALVLAFFAREPVLFLRSQRGLCSSRPVRNLHRRRPATDA